MKKHRYGEVRGKISASEIYLYLHSEENIAGVEGKAAEEHIRRHGLPIGELHCGQPSNVCRGFAAVGRR
jgi:hypothetical protein